MLLTVVVAAALEVSTPTSPPHPLAMAENGLLQCYRPNVQRKTCQSIASYRKTGPGSYDNKALVPLSANATLETHTSVVIKANAVCGFLKAEDVLAGTLRVDSAVVEAEKARVILQSAAQAMAPMANKQICTTYEPSGANFTAKISIEGTYRPDQDQTVKWVAPTDGYTVTP